MDQKKPGFQPLALTLTAGAALLRLVPHPYNFTPVGATAIFGGARLKGWQAYAVPMLAMAVTDPILSHMMGYSAYSWATLVIYASFLISVLLGRVFLHGTSNPGRIASVTVAGSVQFFAITNLYTWWSGTLYSHTAAGLAECFTAAMPFFERTVLGDLFYCGVLFSAYALLSRRSEAHATSRMAA